MRICCTFLHEADGRWRVRRARAAAALAAVAVFAAMLAVSVSSPVAAQDATELCEPGTTEQFSDVAAGGYGSGYILCARMLGLSKGTATGGFDPGGHLSRAQMAAFLVRLWRDTLNGDCPAGSHPFSDVGSDHWANREIGCLYTLGITKGATATTYLPDAKLSAAQITLFTARLLNKAKPGACALTDDEFAQAADCLQALNIAPNTTEATDTATASRAQMTVYLIGAWHHATNRGQPPQPPTRPAMMAVDLSGVCPSPLVVQTDWFPESEQGAMYHLIGDDYVVDTENQTVTGSMVLDGAELGIDFQVRTGGPAIGFAPVSSYMYTDESIHLGYAFTDAQVLQWADAPLISVVAPLEQNPQMIMWDPELPGVDSIADLGTQNVTVNVFGGGVFPLVFVAQGIWNADQVDPSYDGSPARFVSEGGAIAQQGFASSEVYTYEHIYEEWGRPVEFQLLHDAGFQIYSQTIGIRPGDLEELRPCLEKLVPVIQQAAVDFIADPARANAIIVDAVEQYASFWSYPPDLAEFSVQAQIDFGLVGNGPDDTVGNMVGERIAKVLDDMRAAGMDIDPDLTADQLFTNEFIDESIGF